jgi:hypothetical protein
MSNILRAAALTLAAGSSLALMAGPADAAAQAQGNNKGTLMSCVYRNMATGGNISLTADGPDFKQATSAQLAGTHCASWSVKVGQYTVDATENGTCTGTTATVTRDGRTRTLSDPAAVNASNRSPGLFGLTNVAAGKTTRVDWIFSCA